VLRPFCGTLLLIIAKTVVKRNFGILLVLLMALPAPAQWQPGWCPCLGETGIYGSPWDCKEYCMCVDDGEKIHPVYMTCASSAIFDCIKGKCVSEGPLPSSCGCGKTYNKTYTFALINPPYSSVTMDFSGGQRVLCRAINIHPLGVTLHWRQNYAFHHTIFHGVLFPGCDYLYEDSMFGYIPIGYSYKASTGSSVALVSFEYKTNL